MYIPTLEGTIDRRLLVNYRVDPDYLQRLLPGPFRPKLIHGMGIAGICLIRLKQLRPRRSLYSQARYLFAIQYPRRGKTLSWWASSCKLSSD
jgi:hypothetical protein